MNQTRAREHVTAIFRKVLDQVDPERLTRDALSLTDRQLFVHGESIDLRPEGRVVLLGVGKSAAGMAKGVEAVLGDRLDHGLIVTKRGLGEAGESLKRTTVVEASHPVPDKTSLAAGERLLREADDLGPDDLLICVVSGGGSSLVEAPVDGVSLDDFERATTLLLQHGADIWTLNAVRRRLSRIKAGGLARAAAPARLVNLVLSDVLGSPLAVIASGLSVDVSEDDEWRIESLRSGPIWSKLSAAVRGKLDESAAPVSKDQSNVVRTVVVGDAALAARMAAEAAEDLGYRPYLLGSRFAGDADEFARFWAQMAISARDGLTAFDLPCCIVAAGEMTVNVRGEGLGGRNTEMAASAAMEIAGLDAIALASLATDGDDGSSGAAGGVVTGDSVAAATIRGLRPRDLLARNDTRAYLDACDGLIVTGQTGTNVNDIYLALIEPR